MYISFTSYTVLPKLKLTCYNTLMLLQYAFLFVNLYEIKMRGLVTKEQARLVETGDYSLLGVQSCCNFSAGSHLQ